MVSQYRPAMHHLALAHRLLCGPDETSAQLRGLLGRMMDCLEKAERREQAQHSNVISFPGSAGAHPSGRVRN